MVQKSFRKKTLLFLSHSLDHYVAYSICVFPAVVFFVLSVRKIQIWSKCKMYATDDLKSNFHPEINAVDSSTA